MKMFRIVDVLKDPNIVANIQTFFGVSYNRDTANTRTTNENDHHNQENSTMLRKKSNKNLPELDDSKETEELNHKSNNGSLTIEEPASKTESGPRNSPEIRETRNYEVKNKFWYFIFLFGTYLGDDIGYAIFLPFWFWNIDANIARKIVLVWTLIMYLGEYNWILNTYSFKISSNSSKLQGWLSSLSKNISDVHRFHSNAYLYIVEGRIIITKRRTHVLKFYFAGSFTIFVFFLFSGQVSKDIIRWPRPPCPPVIRLQKKWSLEYGMPSTHAMVGVALPSSVLYYTSHRFKVLFNIHYFICFYF